MSTLCGWILSCDYFYYHNTVIMMPWWHQHDTGFKMKICTLSTQISTTWCWNKMKTGIHVTWDFFIWHTSASMQQPITSNCIVRLSKNTNCRLVFLIIDLKYIVTKLFSSLTLTLIMVRFQNAKIYFMVIVPSNFFSQVTEKHPQTWMRSTWH